MSINRFAKKRDIAEEPIITALEQVGWHVWQLDRPSDLLLWHPMLGPGNFKVLEVKTGRGKKLSIAKDKRQQAQANFLSTTSTPVVRTPIEALKAIKAIP